MPVGLLHILLSAMHKHQLRGQVIWCCSIVCRCQICFFLRVPFHCQIPDGQLPITGGGGQHAVLVGCPLNGGDGTPAEAAGQW